MSALFDVQCMVDDLPPLALAVLDQLGSRDDFGYYNFRQLERVLGRDRKQIKAAVAELRKYDLVEFARGLMTEDGEVAGSGYARSDDGDRLARIFDTMRDSVALYPRPETS